MGGVRLELLGYLVLAWVLVYLVIWKGLQNSGKVLKYNQDLIYSSLVMCNFLGFHKFAYNLNCSNLVLDHLGIGDFSLRAA